MYHRRMLCNVRCEVGDCDTQSSAVGWRIDCTAERPALWFRICVSAVDGVLFQLRRSEHPHPQ